MLKSATVNWNSGFDDVCKEKHVIVAYINYPTVFWVSDVTGKMVEYPVNNVVSHWNIAREWEIQAAFFEKNNVKPTWINANFIFGTLNYTTGQWSGAVGLIQRDEADYAMCCFAGTYERSKVAAFSPGIHYGPLYWLTRYPLQLPPIWNLLGLFTKGYISLKSFFETEPHSKLSSPSPNLAQPPTQSNPDLNQFQGDWG